MVSTEAKEQLEATDDRMKVMFLYSGGQSYDYNLYLVSAEVAEEIDDVVSDGDVDEASEIAASRDLTTVADRQRPDWKDLNTIEAVYISSADDLF
jgi:hypothetical protein